VQEQTEPELPVSGQDLNLLSISRNVQEQTEPGLPVSGQDLKPGISSLLQLTAFLGPPRRSDDG
jgi:hypothetical protein